MNANFLMLLLERQEILLVIIRIEWFIFLCMHVCFLSIFFINFMMIDNNFMFSYESVQCMESQIWRILIPTVCLFTTAQAVHGVIVLDLALERAVNCTSAANLRFFH